jgi:hypothetical protein
LEKTLRERGEAMGKYSLLLGCLFLLASVYGYIHWMKTYEEEVTTTAILIAKQYIPAHTKIEGDMIEVVHLDFRLKRDDAWQRLEDVIGKETAIPIGTGEQFIKWKMDILKVAPNPGEQLFTFKTDSIAAVSNMIRRGDEVQIWLELDPNLLRSEWPHVKTSLLPGAMKVLTGVKIAYVRDAQGQEVVNKDRGLPSIIVSQSPADQIIHEQQRSEATGDIVSVTYVLTEMDYEKLLRAQRYGRLKMGFSYTFKEQIHAQGNETKLTHPLSFDYWMEFIGQPTASPIEGGTG